MRLEEKSVVVEELQGRFASAPLVVLTGFSGSTVADLQGFRRAIAAQGMHFRVVKNTLCRRALAGSSKEGMADRLTGNTGVVFSGEDPVAAAKLLREQFRALPKLEVKCGFFDGAVLAPKELEAVADLPSREQLLSTLLGTIIAGPQQLLGVLQAPARDLLGVLSNHAANLEKQ